MHLHSVGCAKKKISTLTCRTKWRSPIPRRSSASWATPGTSARAVPGLLAKPWRLLGGIL